MTLNYNRQSIGWRLFFFKKSFVLENGRLPKKPLRHENGDGCGLVITKCMGFVIN